MLTSVTLDYEMYFGEKAGTVEQCLIDPTNALLDVAQRRANRLFFFVDVGFILRLEEQSRTVQEVARQASTDSWKDAHLAPSPSPNCASISRPVDFATVRPLR